MGVPLNFLPSIALNPIPKIVRAKPVAIWLVNKFKTKKAKIRDKIIPEMMDAKKEKK